MDIWISMSIIYISIPRWLEKYSTVMCYSQGGIWWWSNNDNLDNGDEMMTKLTSVKKAPAWASFSRTLAVQFLLPASLNIAMMVMIVMCLIAHQTKFKICFGGPRMSLPPSPMILTGLLFVKEIAFVGTFGLTCHLDLNWQHFTSLFLQMNWW